MKTTRITVFGQQLVLLGFAFFMPFIARAQELPGTAPQPSTPSAFAQLLAQYLPLILGGLLTALVSVGFPHLRSWLVATSQSAQHGAAVRELAAVLLPVEHLAETIASRLQGDAKNGALTMDMAVKELKGAIGDEGAADLQQVLGVGGDALEKYLQSLLQAKLGGAQLSAATQAGVAAIAKVQALPLNQVAAKLAAGPNA